MPYLLYCPGWFFDFFINEFFSAWWISCSLYAVLFLASALVEKHQHGGTQYCTANVLRSSEVLRSLRHYLLAQSQGHHSLNHLEERGIERGSVQQASLTGWEKSHWQSNQHQNCFKGKCGNFWKTLEHMGFPEHVDTILNWIEMLEIKTVWKTWFSRK